jgi:8-oxo-dGTP pyrophosphatase MutT (NUDIX family)
MMQSTRKRPFIEHTAGFILVNETRDKVLMITTPDGYYGFPKGHREGRDRGSLLATAIRETAEETGVKVKPCQVVKGFKHLAVMNFIRRRSFGKDRPAGPIRKDIHLFMAVIPENTRVKIQKEEVGSYAWIPLKGIEGTLKANLMRKNKQSKKTRKGRRKLPHIALRRRNRLFTDAAKAVRRFLREKEVH